MREFYNPGEVKETVEDKLIHTEVVTESELSIVCLVSVLCGYYNLLEIIGTWASVWAL